MKKGMNFEVDSPYQLAGDQPITIKELTDSVLNIFTFLENKYLGFKDQEINHKFRLWQYEHSAKQIQYILALTGILYIMIGISNLFLAPEYLKNILIPYQLLIIPSYLFLISYLAYKKIYIQIVEGLLISSPIIAASCHAYIFSQMDIYSTYQVEFYLMIFWIFTISGLRFIKAIIAALSVFSIGAIYPYISYANQYNEYFSHTIWMTTSLLFGLVGGFLLHQSKKDTFEKELELQKLVTIDSLTGLHNRVKLDSILAQELDRAKRYKHNVGVLVLDIDYFKNVNDMHGHLIGDEILIAIAKNIQENIRSSDYIFRWGGEEFIVICLEVNKTDITTFAEEIRSKVSQQEFAKVGYKTISIGATINNTEDTVKSILQRADEALYEAKENGRDKVRYK